MMKQQCWKELKQQLCDRDKWIKDQEQSRCQHCAKQFIPVIRRRHHCRFCGNIFCSNCSDFFLNGKYLGLKEKFIRHCEFCHQKIQKFIKDCVKMPDIYEEDQNGGNTQEEQQEDQQFLQIDQQEPIYNLNQIFGQNQQKICSEMINKIDQQIKCSIQKIALTLCQKFHLDTNIWLKKLSQIALKAALETKMDSFTSQGPYQSSMDIVKQVKIKTLVTQPDKITAIIMKGIVLEKNLPSKHMPTHLNKPTMLLIQNSIDIESFSSQMKFQDLMKNQKSIMKKIFQKIHKLSPDIIFVEGNVNFQGIQYFQDNNICVVSKIKKKDLQLIMQIGNVRKTVKKLWLIEKYKPHNILGICDKIYFKSIKEGQTFMFIQADVGIRTIILGQHTQELTNYLKKTMQLLLRYARQMNLQKYLISVDNQISLTFPRSLKFPFLLQVNNQIYKSPENFGLSQEIYFTKIVYGQIKYTSAPKNFIQYGQKIGKSIFFQNCQNVEYQRKKLYASGDITLGGYLLLNIALNQKQCRKCEYPHTQRYYFQNNVIIIKFSKKLNTATSKSSFVELDLQNSEQIVTLQRLKGALKKQKSKLIIQTYIYCQVCQSQINSESIKVGKNYLQNSFFYFLSLLEKRGHLFTSSQKDILKQKVQRSLAKKFRKLSIDKCQHDTLSRVFQYSGCMVKFTIQPFEKFSIIDISLKSKQGEDIVQRNQKKFLANLKQAQLKQKQAFLEDIFAIINGFPFQNATNASFSITQTSIKFIQKMERYQKALGVLQSLTFQFKKLKNQQITLDWTYFLRTIYKYQYIMKLIYEIMEHFQYYLKKRKFDDRLQNQNMEYQQKLQNSPQFENQNHSNITREYTNSQGNISITSSTFINSQYQKARKQSETKDSKVHKVINKIRKQRFPKYEGVFLKYAIGYTFAPVSVLACALNSAQFISLPNQNNYNKDVIRLKMPFYSKIKTSLNLKQQTEAIHKQLLQNGDITKQQSYEITIYFPSQFQKLRIRQGIDTQTYVRSLCGCQSWNSSGGKSNSSFAKSHNEILVVKIINNKEFVQFKKFAQDYLNYIQNKKRQKTDTLLAKIYGIYQISMRGKQYKLVVMQNLFFGLQNITKVYDLKGSEVNRLTIPEDDKSYTGQDTNFKIDKDNNPYILQNHQYDKIISVLQSDANFLKQQQVIDYSLLAIECIQDGKNYLKLGIIDFMRPYHIFEKIQSMYKKAKMGNAPTVIPPDSYAQRFFSAMKKYFIKVN